MQDMKDMKDVLAKMEAHLSTISTNPPTSPTSTSKTYDCPDCKDRGIILFKDDEGEDFARQCHCVRRRKRERLFRKSGISDDFQRLTFKGFDRDRPAPIVNMLKAAVKYRRNFQEIKNTRRNSILLMGSPGSGKTHLLAAVANELIGEDLEDVIYFPYVEGFEALRSDLDGSHEKIRALKECGVLFLDDLFKGREHPTNYEITVIYNIINARYMAHRPIMVSTELSATELIGIDEATGSRIIEMAKDYRVHVTGDGTEMNWRLV